MLVENFAQEKLKHPPSIRGLFGKELPCCDCVLLEFLKCIELGSALARISCVNKVDKIDEFPLKHLFPSIFTISFVLIYRSPKVHVRGLPF
jgi:hypothetical protein